jgi:hypothetical protein
MRPEGHWLDQMPAPSRPSLTPALTPATIVDMPAADPIGTFEDNQKNDSKEMRPEGHWLDQMPARSRPSLTPALTPATIVDMSSVPSSMTENLTEAWHLRQSAKVNSRTPSTDLQSANNLIAMFQAPTPASTVTVQALANPAAVQVNAEAWHLRQSAKVDSRTSSIDLQSANNPIATFQAPTPASTVAAQAPASSAVVHVNAVAKPVLAPARLKLSKEKRQAEIAKREKVIKERENQLLNLEIVSDRIETNLGKIRKGMISSDQFDAKSLEEGHQLARMATGKTMMLSNGEKYQFDTADTKKILDAVSNLKRALKASLNKTTYEASSTTNKNGKMMPRKKVDAEKQAYDLILNAANDGRYANTLRGSFNESVLREFTQEAEENGFVNAYKNAALKLDRAFRLDIIKPADENLFLRRVEGVLFSTVLNQFAKDYNQTGDLIESTIQGMDTIKAAVAAVKGPDGRPSLNHARVLEHFLVQTNHDSNLPKTLIRQQFASEAASIGLPQALKKAFARIDRASKYFITQFKPDVAWEKRQFFQETAYPSFRSVLDAALKEAHETALVQKGVSSEWAYAEVAASLNDLVRALDSGKLHAKLFGAIDDVDYVQGVREKIQREIFPELVRNAHLQMVAENDVTVNHLQLKAAVLCGSGLLAEEAGFVQEVTKLLEKDRTQQNQANLAQNIKAAQNALREAHDLRMEQLLIHVPAKLDELEAAKKAVSDNAEAIEEHANRMIPVDGKQSARLADLIPNAKRIFNFSTDPKRVGLPVVLKEDLSSSPFARIATKYIEEGHHLERKKNRLLEELKAKNKEYIETLAADADDAGFRLVKLNLNSDVENEQEVIESIQSMKDLQAQALEAIHQRYQEMSKPSETSAPLSSLGLAPMPSLTQKKPVLGLPLPRSGISSVPGLLFRLPAAPVQGSFMSNFFSLSRGQKQPLALMPPEPEKEESSLPLTGSGVVSHRKPFSLDDIQVDLDEAADVHLSDADDDADDIIDTPIEKEKIKISLTEEQLAVLTDLEVNP